MKSLKNFLTEELSILESIDAFEPVLCEDCGNWDWAFINEDESNPENHGFKIQKPITHNAPMSKKEADTITGGLSYASKMPSATINTPAAHCKVGSALAKVPGSVCHGCYAKRGNFSFPGVKAGLQKKYDAIDHPKWTEAMTTLVRGQAQKSPEGQKYFRWHASGDIKDESHLKKIFDVARNTPEIKHWLPTHEGTMVARHLMKGNVKPDNLNIRISANMINGPHPTWPARMGLTTSGVHTKDKAAENAHHDCPAHLQGNVCGSCRHCWDSKVPSVSYLKH